MIDTSLYDRFVLALATDTVNISTVVLENNSDPYLLFPNDFRKLNINEIELDLTNEINYLLLFITAILGSLYHILNLKLSGIMKYLKYSIFSLLIGSFFLNASVWAVFSSLFLTLFIAISVFTTIGMGLGYLFNSQETALIASISVVLFSIIFSPLINPLESAPLLIRSVLSYTPLVLVENILRKTLLYESGISYNLLGLLILSFTAVSLFVITNLIYLLSKDKEIK
jgi:hypothetical protein